MAEKNLTPEQQRVADKIVEAIIENVPFFMSWGNRTGKTTVMEYVDNELDRRRYQTPPDAAWYEPTEEDVADWPRVKERPFLFREGGPDGSN